SALVSDSHEQSGLSSTEARSALEHDTLPPSKWSDELVGKVLHGYRVEERIGGGISAVVYRAHHQVLAKECAVKGLCAGSPSEEAAERRLRREAEMLSRFSHENIVSVIDFGTTPDGRPFLMTELLRGRTLQAAIEAGAPFPRERAAGIARQIAAGLAAAHEHG